MSELQNMLRVQARLHRKQGVNALGDLFDNANGEIESLRAQLAKANQRIKGLEEDNSEYAKCIITICERGDIQEYLKNNPAYEKASIQLNKFAREQQIKGIEDAIAYAPSKENYALPIVDTTDLYDYAEQLRKEQECEQ